MRACRDLLCRKPAGRVPVMFSKDISFAHLLLTLISSICPPLYLPYKLFHRRPV
ncbi:hypothetical protein Mapa_001167 [Marchantia paleacea]|nr:hypothetical protein Mapa_001167 [Marchantia paleacea]